MKHKASLASPLNIHSERILSDNCSSIWELDSKIGTNKNQYFEGLIAAQAELNIQDTRDQKLLGDELESSLWTFERRALKTRAGSYLSRLN